MKKLMYCLLGIVLIVSCSKDEVDNIDELINAKWNVENSSEYESFEFNDSGNYIIVKGSPSKKSSVVLFGTYEYSGDNLIILSDFGTLEITDINDNSISFSIKLEGGTDNVVIQANKQSEIENTTKTKLLCRTWMLSLEDGEPITDPEDELTVLFSAAGTYLITYPNAGWADLAHWKWANEAETQILYSWENPPVWNSDDIAEIIELTEDRLIIREELTHYVSTSTLIPYNGKKTSSLMLEDEFEEERKY